MKRYKCLNSFDVSNFTKHCGVHNVPFSARNMSNYICNEPSCKHALHHVLEEEIDHLSTKCFFFVDEKLCLTDDIFN